MRTKKKYKMINVTEEIYNKIIADREHFQKVIGGGKWSIDDTFREYYKIMGTRNDKQ